MTLRLANTAPVRWAGLLMVAGLVVALLGLVAAAAESTRIGSLVALGLGAGGIIAGTAWTWVRRVRARRGLSVAPASRLWWVAAMELCIVVALGLALWPWRAGLAWLGGWMPAAPVVAAGWIAWRLLRTAEPRALGRARAALAQGDGAAALQALEELGRAQPQESAQWVLRARILRGRGDLAGAEQAAQRAVALRPRLYYGHAELGQAELAQGRPREAVATLERAAACAPYLGEAHLELGLARLALPDPAGAAPALAQALHLGLRDPIHALMARYRLWRALQGLGLAAEAEREERRLRRLRGLLRDWQPLPDEVALRDEMLQALQR